MSFFELLCCVHKLGRRLRCLLDSLFSELWPEQPACRLITAAQADIGFLSRSLSRLRTGSLLSGGSKKDLLVWLLPTICGAVKCQHACCPGHNS